MPICRRSPTRTTPASGSPRPTARSGRSSGSSPSGLIELGIEKGDKVSILANTRPEWTYFDFAALSVGATVVPIYQTNSPEECQYVIENSDAKAVVVEDSEQLAKIDEIRDRVPKLEQVIRMEGSGGGAISMDELIEAGKGHSDSEWEQRWQSVTPEDICTFIYTSGTTGPPKGCVISHGNYRSMVTMALDESLLDSDTTTYLFLPLAHSFALLIQFLSFDLGGNIAYWERDPLKIIPNLVEVKPEYFPSVPRIFEKIYTAATGEVEKSGGIKKLVFNWAIGVGKKVRQKERAGEPIGWLLRKQYEIADRQVLSKIRALFGGRIKNCVTGAAPINPEILRFFDAAGVLILEGWGMTETSTAATVARPDASSSARWAARSTAARSRSPMTARSWSGARTSSRATTRTRRRPRRPSRAAGSTPATSGSSTRTATSRSPAARRTSSSPRAARTSRRRISRPRSSRARYVSQCVVIGDRRPYLVALITLDMEECAKLCEEKGWPRDPAELATTRACGPSSRTHLDKVNEKFARVEQVKKFEILPHDLSQETGELTPTMKVKRNVVADKFEKDVDALYA